MTNQAFPEAIATIAQAVADHVTEVGRRSDGAVEGSGKWSYHGDWNVFRGPDRFALRV